METAENLYLNVRALWDQDILVIPERIKMKWNYMNLSLEDLWSKLSFFYAPNIPSDLN